VLQCVAVCCSVLQRVAVCCSVLQCAASSGVQAPERVAVSVLFAVYFSVLQCGIVCCSVLQRVAVNRSGVEVLELETVSEFVC